MLRLLDSDFYKVKKGKSIIVCSIIVAVLYAMSLAMYCLLAKIPETGVKMDGKTVYLISLTSTNIMIIIAIWASRFFGNEFTNGTIKIMLSKGNSRTSIYLSKLTVSLVVAYLFELINLVISLGLGSLILGYDKKFSREESMMIGLVGNGEASVKNLLFTILARAVLILCIVATINMLVSFVKKTGSAIAISICFIVLGSIGFLLVDAIYQLLRDKFDVLPKPYFDINDLWIINNTSKFATFGYDAKMWQLLGLMFAVYGVLATLLGIRHFNKKDIN